MKNKTVGIVGQGFVGSAIREGLASYFNIEPLDRKRRRALVLRL